tara:strand:- start:60 stop:530 length:471 start_codon:yes stop_codon:yes gene_type:complete
MKLSRLNEWLTLTVNVGVIAGIIFLAFELQQNTRMMQAQTRDSVTDKLSEFLMSVGSNEYASDIFFRRRAGEFEPGSEDSLNWNSFFFMAMSNMRMWENEWFQYQAGLFGEDEFAARSSTWRTLIRFPGYRSAWQTTRNGYERSFKEFVDSMIEEN